MSAIDLDAIRARAEKATRVIPGQWITSGNEVGEWTGEPDVLEGPMVTVHFDGVPGRDVADFIAHAREDVPALLAEIDRLLALVTEPLDPIERTVRRLTEAQATEDELGIVRALLVGDSVYERHNPDGTTTRFELRIPVVPEPPTDDALTLNKHHEAASDDDRIALNRIFVEWAESQEDDSLIERILAAGFFRRPRPLDRSEADLSALQRSLFEECEVAGWDPEKRNTFAEECAHLHEEVSEAFREWRLFKDFEIRYDADGKPTGIPIEFADVLIGLFYNAELHGFDLLAAVELKHRYNLTRDYQALGRQLHPIAVIEGRAS